MILSMLLCSTMQAQPHTDKWFSDFLYKRASSNFKQVLDSCKEYRVQIIYTKIDRDKDNIPHFSKHHFNVDENLYFNPASTVKLPLAILSLEKLHQLSEKKIDKNTTIFFDSSYTGQTPMVADETSENGKPSIAHFIKKALLVSDNDAYNRMYEFLGPKYINARLQAMGYANTRIMHRFVGMTLDQNRHTNAVHFYNDGHNEVYYQPKQYDNTVYDHSRNERMGKAYMTNDDKIIHKPFDFSVKNRISLPELTSILQAIIFPKYVKPTQRFDLTDDDYAFLYQYLSQFPGETNYPKYDQQDFYDSYVKYFFRNKDHHEMPSSVRVFNKVGWSYGFLTDISYITDFKNNIEFMLSAVIYTNKNQTINDGIYEYEQRGLPFLYELGQMVYAYELNRLRTHAPDLSNFSIKYDTQTKDNRPLVTNVDN